MIRSVLSSVILSAFVERYIIKQKCSVNRIIIVPILEVSVFRVANSAYYLLFRCL